MPDPTAKPLTMVDDKEEMKRLGEESARLEQAQREVAMLVYWKARILGCLQIQTGPFNSFANFYSIYSSSNPKLKKYMQK